MDGFFFSPRGVGVDKDSKEALQVAKEMVAKFIEARSVSPNNFAEVFPAVYRVVLDAVSTANAPAEGAARADRK